MEIGKELETECTGRRKAAALLIALGTDISAKILRMMESEEVDLLATEITKIRNLPPEVSETLIEEFYQKISTSSVSNQGGIAYATAMLSKALGAESAMNAIERIREDSNSVLFDSLMTSSGVSATLLEIIGDEHPQTIALILSHLKEPRASQVLDSLSPEIQADVIMRIANMKTVSPEIISQIEASLKEKTRGHERVRSGGIKIAASILNRANIDVEKRVMESITKQDPELAEKISELMFTYEDIAYITDKGIQKLLLEVDEYDLIMALKASTEEMKAKIFLNMSERRRQTIQDDIMTIPPVRLRDVQAAQGRMLATAKELIQSGQIEVIRDSAEEVFV